MILLHLYMKLKIKYHVPGIIRYSLTVLWEMEQLVAICRLLRLRSHLSLRTSLIFRMDNLPFAIHSSSIVFEEEYR